MLFAYDIVLVDGSRYGVNAKLERWREALESKSFRISRTKAAYMDCNFSRHIERSKITMRIEDQEIPQSDSMGRLIKMSNT